MTIRRGPNAVPVALLLPRDPTEKEVEHAGDKMMTLLGFEVIRFSQPRKTMQTRGIPDRRYYHRELRLTVWWEAKAPKGKQSPDQKKFQELVERCGEEYVLGTTDPLADWCKAALVRARRGWPETAEAAPKPPPGIPRGG